MNAKIVERIVNCLCLVTDKLSEIINNDAATKQVSVLDCNNVATSTTVDVVSATHLLNQKNKHTEILYGTLQATITGNLVPVVAASTTVSFLGAYAGITFSNDTLLAYITDFGNGYTDVGNTASYNFINDPAGHYEIKTYALMASGNVLLIAGTELDWNGTTVTFSTPIPSPVSRTYPVLRDSVAQDYCDTVLVGGPYNPNKSAYTLTAGETLEFHRPIIRNDYLDTSDANNERLVRTVTETISSGATTPIPAGSKSVTVTRVAGTVKVAGYTLSATSPSITLDASEFDGINNYRLPAIAITGGGAFTWIRTS